MVGVTRVFDGANNRPTIYFFRAPLEYVRGCRGLVLDSFTLHIGQRLTGKAELQVVRVRMNVTGRGNVHTR